MKLSFCFAITRKCSRVIGLTIIFSLHSFVLVPSGFGAMIAPQASSSGKTFRSFQVAPNSLPFSAITSPIKTLNGRFEKVDLALIGPGTALQTTSGLEETIIVNKPCRNNVIRINFQKYPKM